MGAAHPVFMGLPSPPCSCPTQCLGEGGSHQAKPGGPAGGGREGPFLLTQTHTTVCPCVAFGAWGSLVLPDLTETHSTPLSDSPVLKQDYSRVAPLTFGARSFFVVKGRSLHYRVFRHIPGLYPLDASSSPPPQVVTTKKVYRNCRMSPWGQKSLGLRTMVLNQQCGFNKQSHVNFHCHDGEVIRMRP